MWITGPLIAAISYTDTIMSEPVIVIQVTTNSDIP
jgi:hypothetical protein